jgi:hypothetical protein
MLLLEHVLHADDEWMLHTQHDVLLQSQVLQLLTVNDYILPDTLHSVYESCLFLLDHVNLSKGALTNNLLHHKVI